MTDEEFLRALDGGLIDPAAFHHVDHVRAANSPHLRATRYPECRAPAELLSQASC
jgi:hypothetical protein